MCIHAYVSNWPKRWVSNPLLIKIKKHLVKQSITTTLSNSFLVFQNLIVFSLENTHTHTHYIGLMESFICPKESRALCLKGEGSGLTSIIRTCER